MPPASRAPLPVDESGSARIVGLGASAGGLAALVQFLSHVPPGSGLAYIVVQHLDPTHKAMLVELLQRSTAMPVCEAAEAMRVERDVVYVIPPNRELTVAGGLLHLAPPEQPRGVRLPIDVLFNSLACHAGANAIGVVLSGMGSDGTLGLRAIQSQGGLTLAQQPDSAQFDSMPQSAITAGAADIVALPADLPQHILHVVAAVGAGRVPERAGDDGNATALEAILALLRERSKHDLSPYKRSTLNRRIERRMAVHKLATMAAYASHLRQNPQEIDLLFKEMMIGVTAFFRDAAVWQELQSVLLPALLASRPTSGVEPTRLRAWVAGCSTGEEAYSLALVFAEAADLMPEPGQWSLQIFGTDLSADAIAVARKGFYPARIAQDMPAERLARFFRPQGDGFVIDSAIREKLLFAQHDVTLDPPFTRLDILCCRNLLIYFDAPLQRRLLPLFHYSLRPGGLLVLGGSETVGRSLALFTPVSPKSRLYRRSDNADQAGLPHFPVHRRRSSRTPAQESNVSEPVIPVNLQSLADQVVLQEFSPPTVLVNEQGDIVYISGHTGKYLEPGAGKANWNIHAMARPGLRMPLAAALRQAVQDGKPVDLRGLSLDDDTLPPFDVTVQAMQQAKALAGLILIVFREVPAPAAKRRRRRPAGSIDPVTAEELMRSQHEIRALSQEMRASAEELQAANEELQSANEELQSANEELTTSKEEAQSMNEELQTINTELQSKLDDLALAQSDMQNLLNSTDIATLFLDNALNVRRFTEQMTRIIPLRDSDIGRPLSDLASTLIYPQLHADAKETLRSLAFSEKQISTTDGHWFSVRIMPYRTLANVIQGAVITFVDITATKELESRLRKA